MVHKCVPNVAHSLMVLWFTFSSYVFCLFCLWNSSLVRRNVTFITLRNYATFATTGFIQLFQLKFQRNTRIPTDLCQEPPEKHHCSYAGHCFSTTIQSMNGVCFFMYKGNQRIVLKRTLVFIRLSDPCSPYNYNIRSPK